MLRADEIILDRHEHYVKQTHRNRALIYGANGIHPLIIPVVHEGQERKPIGERKISYDSPWQKIHWRTLTSSYRNSPYFEYFEDDFRFFYETKTETLFDLNLMLLQKILLLLKVEKKPGFSSSYETKLSSDTIDRRNAFDDREQNKNFPPYNQVFAERFGFVPDLSIADLLFNKGLESKNYLESLR